MKLQQEITQHIHTVLQLDSVNISPQDNLIEHGLHSLAIMQLVDVFEKKYQKPLSYTDFAMSPTVEDWVSIINSMSVSSEVQEPAVALSYSLPSASVALSDMQYAYWAGRQSENTAAHLYMEFAGQNLDIQKLQTAYQKLVQRHPMLNASIINGRQSIQALEHQRIQIHDLSHLDQADVAAALQNRRQQMSHQQLAIQNGQVIDIHLSLLPDHQHILHIDSDMIAIDPQSYLIVVEDLTALYLGKTLSPLNSSSIDYFDYLQQRSDDPNYHAKALQDQQWWQNRLDQIAPAPDLPFVPEGLRENPQQFERLAFRFTDADKKKLQQIAEKNHLSVQSLCLTAFAETVATWSSSPQFRLNLPFFVREPYQQAINDIVGDFANLSLLDVQLNAQESFYSTVQRIEQQVQQAHEHYAYAGIHVLRDLSKRHQQLETSPIVFTSALEVGEIFSEDLQLHLGQPVWCISQGPKVDLDVQIAYFNQGLVINWDIRSHAFKPHVIQHMFEHYIAQITAMIQDETRIHAPMAYQLPAAQHAQRQAQPATLAAHVLAQLPVDCDQYRVVNPMGIDCPDWVIGTLWGRVQAQDIKQHSGLNLKLVQGQYWYPTRYAAYYNDDAEIILFEDQHQLVKINGYWLDLNQLCQKILDIPEVAHAKLYSVHQDGKNRLIACLVLSPQAELKQHQLNAAYTARLPQYLIPEQSYLISAEQFTQVQADNIQEFIDQNQSLAQRSSAQTQTPLEQVVYFMMSKIIGLQPDQPNANIDFFDYGGDSLLATHFVAALHRYFKDCGITVVDIFSQRTVQNIAKVIEQNIPQSAHKIAEVFLKVLEGKK